MSKENIDYRAIVERIAEMLHGGVTDIGLLTVTVQSYKDRLAKIEAERDVLAAENAALKNYHPQPQGVAMMTALDAFFEHEDVPEQGMMEAFEILFCKQPESPATDAFLREVKAQAITSALDSLDGVFDTDCVMETNGISYEEAEQRTTGALAVNSALIEFAAHLRQGGAA
ncbi:hypothetical protein ACINJI_002825 [Cronobacter dublinensis]